MIETIRSKTYKTKTVIKPDLDKVIEIKEEEENKRYFITNCLFIKCPICITFKLNCIIQKCGHILCKDCFKTYIQTFNKLQCWMCRQISYDKNNNNDNNNVLLKL